MHAHEWTDRDIPGNGYWATERVVLSLNWRSDALAIGVRKPAGGKMADLRVASVHASVLSRSKSRWRRRDLASPRPGARAVQECSSPWRPMLPVSTHSPCNQSGGAGWEGCAPAAVRFAFGWVNGLWSWGNVAGGAWIDRTRQRPCRRCQRRDPTTDGLVRRTTCPRSSR